MDCIMIGIAGGTGSGKSTFTNRLKDYFGDDVTVIYHDNYYRQRDDMTYEERTKVNYDHPSALETELLIEHLKKLKEGESIECPIYDFTQHNRSNKSYTIHPSKIFLIEGILIFSDEQLRDLFDIKVFAGQEIMEWYHCCGMKMPSRFVGRPDSIHMKLEFAIYLTGNIPKHPDDPDHQKIYDTFLRRFFLPHMDRILAQRCGREQFPFYYVLCAVIQAYLT